ncbi:hypothetical protein RFI_10136 [Reticulomyxa filosa]|uniref:Uncharacterized protein n=1 Tax=Reticulomyxa filosa TaxID=46433 RepID=X6NLW9_RETFI|nr:hypothetical protein RFI_10136 [Reticulomyxa filosa]|eukprot:ETO26996.1 hypothetical protein RFI_10136 [Reticulomyxa filosa]
MLRFFLVHFSAENVATLLVFHKLGPFKKRIFYADDIQLRKKLFNEELLLFQNISKKLLLGYRKAFKRDKRYYVYSREWNEYTSEYMHKVWSQSHSHIDKGKYLKGAHPSCAILNSKDSVFSDRDKGLDKVQKIAVYFTHACCEASGPEHARSALHSGGFDRVIHYTMHNLTSRFRTVNSHILSQTRGAVRIHLYVPKKNKRIQIIIKIMKINETGYWLWKPYIILDVMLRQLKACDIVCYTDTGTTWINSAGAFWELTSKIKYGVLTFNQKPSEWQRERYWSKRDAFILMKVDRVIMYNTLHKQASFACFQKNPDSIHFLNEWLYWSMDDRILTDRPSELAPNLVGFRENRHDQTILSLLSKKYGIPGFTDPTQYAAHLALQWGPVVKHWKQEYIILHTRNKTRL